jgi:hypothetical protein
MLHLNLYIVEYSLSKNQIFPIKKIEKKKKLKKKEEKQKGACPLETHVLYTTIMR